MENLNELYALIGENEKQLGDVELKIEAQKIIVIDGNVESSDEAFVFEGYGVREAYDFLNANGYLLGE
jgi:hypothetical protein